MAVKLFLNLVIDGDRSRGVDVVRVPTDVSASDRARWLGELSDALDQAQSLVWQLAAAKLREVETLDLAARVEAARAEVRSLRLARVAESVAEVGPEWTHHSLWDRSLEDPSG